MTTPSKNLFYRRSRTPVATMKTVEKRRMCPNCRAFITISDRVCPYCGVQLGPRAIDLRATQFLSSFMPRANITSVVILIINVAFFLVTLIVNYQLSRGAQLGNINGTVLILLGGKYAPLIQHGQWWRLITAGFLHAGFLHIAMNSWALFDLVGEVEQFYGTSRLIVAYIFSTFAGFWLSLMWAPQSLSLGASAACFGLIGIMLAMGLRRNDPLARAVRVYYQRWAIYGLIFSFAPFFRVDIAAHIGGLIGGFLVGWIGGLPGVPGSPRETIWKVLAAFAILVTLYAFAQDYISYRALLRQM
ncbi:MAG TPA: rhomboid family intramembrane serine protease [Bryobacteraceae bacterium]|nr:rhomboid family intramembrane serine protease [Bryobacteraceae bacterium]